MNNEIYQNSSVNNLFLNQENKTEWFYDIAHNAVLEKRIDGSNITHIAPAGGKSLLDTSVSIFRKLSERK